MVGRQVHVDFFYAAWENLQGERFTLALQGWMTLLKWQPVQLFSEQYTGTLTVCTSMKFVLKTQA